MRLGRLIELLGAYDSDGVVIGSDGKHPARFTSYRGYYNQLAIVPGVEPTTVGQMLALARAANGKTFQGYKGGDYHMDESTAVWWSEYGEASSIGISDPFQASRHSASGVMVLTVTIPLIDVTDYQGW